MENSNQSSVSKFILLGLSKVPYLQATYFLLFLLMYIATLSGNILLIVVVRSDTQLHTPMYFFLSNLSFIDICFSSTIVPKILANTLAKDRSISFLGCAVQMFFYLGLGATESVLLAVMAYDRYAAICRPLQYNSIIGKHICRNLAAGSWFVSFLNSGIHAWFTFHLPFCKSNYLNHFFCEIPPLLRLSCRDTWLYEIAVFISGILLGSCSFLLIIVSYVHIISTILKIRSNKGKNKSFSTCASHFIVVFLYYGAIMFTYLRPRSSYSPDRDRAVSILYTVVTPMLNPIIYSIRNKEVKGSLRKLITIISCSTSLRKSS
ncbi:olfactory receptor 5V1-like [Rhinophrynus dorsalis]